MPFFKYRVPVILTEMGGGERGMQPATQLTSMPQLGFHYVSRDELDAVKIPTKREKSFRISLCLPGIWTRFTLMKFRDLFA